MRRLLAAAALTLLPVMAVAAEEQPVTIAPFEVLESYPGCGGPGKIAYRVAFDEPQAKARFGIAGQRFEAVCKITTRKGSDIVEQTIPCREKITVVDPLVETMIAQLPRSVAISGQVVGCFGLEGHSFITTNWRLSGNSLFGPFQAEGNAASPGASITFYPPVSSEILQPPEEGSVVPKVSIRDKALLAMIFEQIDVGLPTTGIDELRITSYLVVAPEVPQITWCKGNTCRSEAQSASDVMWSFDFDRASKIVRFLEEP